MKCPAVVEWLPLAVSGDLPQDLLADVERHVETCQACRNVADGWSQGMEALEGAAEAEPEVNFDSFFQGVLAKVPEARPATPEIRPAPAQEPAAPPRRAPREISPARHWATVLAAAAAVALLVSGGQRWLEGDAEGGQNSLNGAAGTGVQAPDQGHPGETSGPRKHPMAMEAGGGASNPDGRRPPRDSRRLLENFSRLLPELEHMLNDTAPAPGREIEPPMPDGETKSF